jgi:VWFA-related protein
LSRSASACSGSRSCTKDADRLERAFAQLRPGEIKSARLLDAAQQAIERLRQRPNARRVLLLISETRDRGSETGLDTVLVNAQSAGVTIYVASYSVYKTAFTAKAAQAQSDTPREPQQPPGTRTGVTTPKGKVTPPAAPQQVDILAAITELLRLGTAKTTEALVQGTGGAAFPFTRQKGLETAIGKLGAELHSQYLLSFTPVQTEPGYHRQTVKVPSRPGVLIRARPAYWSMGSSSE